MNEAERFFGYSKVIVCAACGKEDDWEGFEDVYRVTGQEGQPPVLVTIAGCACGHQQEVMLDD
jgi:hypothetical protein